MSYICFLVLATFFGFTELDLISQTECETKSSCKKPDRDIRECQCDSECWYYGDCCKDATRITKEQYVKHRLFGINFKCSEFQTSDFVKKSFYTVNDCLVSWPFDSIRTSCRHNTSHFASVPVTNPSTFITYKNVYCALCNNLNFKDVSFWTLNIKCPSFPYNYPNYEKDHNIFYDSFSSQWYIRFHKFNITRECSKFTLPADNLLKLRTCSNHGMDLCLREYPIQLRLLCQIFKALRYNMQQQMYKNEFCAMCNGVEISELTCTPYPFLSTPLHISFINPIHFGHFFSLNMNLENAFQLSGGINHCSPGSIINNFGKCQPLSCSSDSELVNGVCQQID